MGAPTAPPKPKAAPAPVDATKAMLDAMSYAETQRKIRQSTGRKGTFLTSPQTFSPNSKSMLGM